MLKYTTSKKIGVFLYNLLKAHWKEILNFLVSKINKKYKLNIDLKFSWDLTAEADFDDRDYTLSSEEAKKLPKIERDKLYLIDQGRKWRTRNSCVPTNVYLSICNNLNIKPDYNELLDWLNWLEKKKLWRENYGASIPKVIKAMTNRWNELHPDRLLRYDRLAYNNLALLEALNNGYEVVGGRNTFSAYSKDKRDGKIDFWNYTGWKRAWGHCLNIMLWKEIKNIKQIEITPTNTEKEANGVVHSDNIHCVNSYPTTQKEINIYEHSRIGKHCQNRIWYSRFYLIREEDPKPKEKPTTIKEVKEINKETNKYYKFIEDDINNGYKPVFNDLFEAWTLTAGEIKTLIEIARIRDIEKK